MPKQTQYEEVKNLMLVVSFNKEERNLSTGMIEYVPVFIEARGDAITTEGGNAQFSKELKLGDLSETKLTNKQIYTKVNNFNSQLGALLKDLVLDVLNEDVSI